MAIDVKALSATMADPTKANLGARYQKPPKGSHVLTVTGFESRTSNKDRKTFITVDLEVAASDTATAGEQYSFAWFIENDPYGYVLADLRRFVDAAARKTSQQSPEFYGSVLGKALDGNQLLVGVQITCAVAERPYTSKAGKAGTATDYTWGISQPELDAKAASAANAKRRAVILGGAAATPAPVQVTAPPPKPEPVKAAPAPVFDIDSVDEDLPF